MKTTFMRGRLLLSALFITFLCYTFCSFVSHRNWSEFVFDQQRDWVRSERSGQPAVMVAASVFERRTQRRTSPVSSGLLTNFAPCPEAANLSFHIRQTTVNGYNRGFFPIRWWVHIGTVKLFQDWTLVKFPYHYISYRVHFVGSLWIWRCILKS